MIILFCSCSPDTSSYEYLFEGGRDESEELPIEVDTFILVLPADASGAVYDATASLAQKIKENTLSDTKIVYDYEKAEPKSRDILILVGKTSYEESQRFLQDFRADDFGYTYSERTVLICGVCENSLLSAIEKFRKDIVLYADSELFITNGTEYIFRAEYDIKRIDLNGYQLCDYTLVYPNGDTDAFTAASYFHGILAENTGYYLDIKSDSQISKTARAICIGKTKLDTTVSNTIGKGASLITEYPNGISVISDNLYTTKRALDSLLNILSSTDSSSVADIQISSFAPNMAEFNEVTMTDVSKSALSSTEALGNTANTIREKSLGFIRLSNVSESTANFLSYTLGSKYSLLSIGNSQIHYIYDNTKYNINYKKCDGDTVSELYLVTCSALASGASFSLFEIHSLPSTEKAVLSIVKEISSVIDTSEIYHGAIFFEPFDQLDTFLANTLKNANRVSERTYTFGDGTFLDSMRTENGFTDVTLTLYR